MSFVRAGREIQTVDVFPRSAKDKASGLGDWPLLQAYAYSWGIEVRFGPELDEVFGITNDKQSVRPMEDFWRVMTQAEIDTAARREQKWQTDTRAKAKNQEPSDTPTEAEAAAGAADRATDQRPEIPRRELRVPTARPRQGSPRAKPPRPAAIWRPPGRRSRRRASTGATRSRSRTFPSGPWSSRSGSAVSSSLR